MKCTCPEWWFPPDKREKLRELPHNYEGVLQHHESCNKTKNSEEIISISIFKDEEDNFLAQSEGIYQVKCSSSSANEAINFVKGSTLIAMGYGREDLPDKIVFEVKWKDC